MFCGAALRGWQQRSGREATKNTLRCSVMMEQRRGTAQIKTASPGVLRNQQSTQKPALFATRSLAVYSRRSMILKPSLSFAGRREYRWQGLELPAMMGKRRGTAEIAWASPAGRAARYRHKNLLFSQLARSLCTACET
jgi:hypothetical protein